MADEQENRQEPAVESREVVPVGSMFPRFPTQAEWNTLNIIAKTLRDGGVLPKGIDTVQKMVVILQAGREMGLQPIEALNSLYFVNGKVAMYGEAVPLQIIRCGHFIDWGECNEKTATVTLKRGDTGKTMTTTFTMEMAVERGYTKNELYKKFPENMLKWRALSMTAKFLMPDALRGMGIKEDLEIEVVEEGSRFHSAPDAKRVESEVKSGEYGKRPALSDALAQEDAPADVPAIEQGGTTFPCGEEGCNFVAKTKAGRTKHLAAQHLKNEKPQGK